MSGRVYSQKGCQALEQAAQGDGRVATPGCILEMCECGTWGHSLVVDLSRQTDHWAS